MVGLAGLSRRRVYLVMTEQMRFWPLDVNPTSCFDENAGTNSSFSNSIQTARIATRHRGKAGIQSQTKFIADYDVPPLPEQQRIVGILDEAFEGIATAKANAEKNLQNARAIFESHLQSVFTQRGEGWVEKSLWRCL